MAESYSPTGNSLVSACFFEKTEPGREPLPDVTCPT